MFNLTIPGYSGYKYVLKSPQEKAVYTTFETPVISNQKIFTEDDILALKGMTLLSY